MPTTKAEMIAAAQIALDVANELPDDDTTTLPQYTWAGAIFAANVNALPDEFELLAGDTDEGLKLPPNVNRVVLEPGRHSWTGDGHADPDQQEAHAMLTVDRDPALGAVVVDGTEGEHCVMGSSDLARRCSGIRVKHGSVTVQYLVIKDVLSAILCEAGSDGDLIVTSVSAFDVLRYAAGYWGRRNVGLHEFVATGAPGIGENLTRFYCNSLVLDGCLLEIPEQQPGGKGICALWCVEAPNGVTITEVESHGRLRFGYGVGAEQGGGTEMVGPVVIEHADVESWQSAGTPIELGPRVTSAMLGDIHVTNWAGQGDDTPKDWWLYLEGRTETDSTGHVHPAVGTARWTGVVRNNESLHGLDGVKYHGPLGDWQEIPAV